MLHKLLMTPGNIYKSYNDLVYSMNSVEQCNR